MLQASIVSFYLAMNSGLGVQSFNIDLWRSTALWQSTLYLAVYRRASASVTGLDRSKQQKFDRDLYEARLRRSLFQYSAAQASSNTSLRHGWWLG